MALFDSIVAGVKDRAGLSGDKAGGLLGALLGVITDPRGGGFSGLSISSETRGWVISSTRGFQPVITRL